MDSYVSNVSDRITGITGDPDKVACHGEGLRHLLAQGRLDDGDYTMDHTASVLLLDSGGGFAGTIAYGENPERARPS